MSLERHLKIDNHEWRLNIAIDGSIDFAYLKPVVWGEDPLDGLWHDWSDPDSVHYQPSYIYDETNILPGTSVFRVKNELLEAIAQMIRQSGRDMVFFKSVDEQRGRIYTNIVNVLIEKLGGNWSCQVIENKWFYFTRTH